MNIDKMKYILSSINFIEKVQIDLNDLNNIFIHRLNGKG